MTRPANRTIHSTVVGVTVANVLRGLLGFLAGLLLARGLGPAGRGEFTFVTNSATLIVMLAGGGVTPALSHMKAIRGHSVAALYASSAVISAATGAAGVAVWVLGFFIAPQLFSGIGAGEVLWVALLVIPLLTLTHWTAVGYLENRVLLFSGAAVVGSASFLISIIGLGATGLMAAGTVVTAWAISAMLPLVVIAVRRLHWPRKGVLTLSREILRYGIRANFATLALVLTWRLDVVLVKTNRGLAELGLYAVAVGLAEVVVQIGISFRVALTPRQGSSHDREQLIPSITRATRGTMALGVAATVGAFVLGPRLLVTLYGDAFEPAGAALLWLMPGVVALLVQGPLMDYVLVEHKLRAATAITSVALVLNVAMNVVLLRNFSFVAAAISSTIAYTVSCAGCVALFCHETGERPTRLLVPTREDVEYVRRVFRRRPPAAE